MSLPPLPCGAITITFQYPPSTFLFYFPYLVSETSHLVMPLCMCMDVIILTYMKAKHLKQWWTLEAQTLIRNQIR